MPYPPPRTSAPLVLSKVKESYRRWHTQLMHLPRIERNTLGAEIDQTFLAVLELIFQACFAGDRFEKLSRVSSAIAKADLVKFLLQLGWEGKLIDHKLYGVLLLDLDEVGRMLGGWKRMLSNKTPAREREKS